MATCILTGNLGNFVGGPLASLSGGSKAYLLPYYEAGVEASEVRIGPVELTLDVDSVFSQSGVPVGTYRVIVRYFHATTRRKTEWSSGFFVLAGNSDLSALITLPAPDPLLADGVLIVPVTSANSGTAFTVTAPLHNEKRLKLTLTGSPTLTLSGGTAAEVCAVQLHLIQDATGSRTVTWPGNVNFGVAGTPVLSAAAGKIDLVYLTTDDGGAAWQGALVGSGY